jgi:hypothetical protein
MRYNVGDKVICVSYYDRRLGGAGYEPNKVFVVNKIRISSKGYQILLPLGGHGVYGHAVELCDPLGIIRDIKKHVMK